MKAKLTRGSGSRGVFSYVADPKRAEHITGTMSGIDADTLHKEFESVRALRPTIKKPVWHCSLALPEGESVPNETWEKITHRFMGKMGFDEKTPYSSFKHNDTDYDHTHIVACRVNVDGQIWHGKNDVQRAIKATQELEKEFDLTITQDFYRKEEKTLSKNEVEKAIRTEELPIKTELKQHLTEVMKQPCTVQQFCEKLEERGITPLPNIAKTGKMNGFSFELKGIPHKGSDVGHSFKKLLNKGLKYEQNRDSDFLAELRQTSGQPQALGADVDGNERATSSDSDRSKTDHQDGRKDLSTQRENEQSTQPDRGSEPSAIETTSTNTGAGANKELSGESVAGRRSEIESDSTEALDEDFKSNTRLDDRSIASRLWAERFRQSPTPSRRATKQQNVTDDHRQSVSRGSEDDKRDSESMIPGERESLVEELQDIDELIHDYRQIHAELEAQLEDVIPPKRVDFKADDYSENSYEDLLETKEIREEILQGYRDTVWSLEDEVEKKENSQDKDYGMSM